MHTCMFSDSSSIEGGTVGHRQAVLLSRARSYCQVHHQTRGRMTQSTAQKYGFKTNCSDSVHLKIQIMTFQTFFQYLNLFTVQFKYYCLIYNVRYIVRENTDMQ